ncbi:hypothetical protein P7C71_g5392, partial [Lecanoromycetidae sp. Uapishka_2]
MASKATLTPPSSPGAPPSPTASLYDLSDDEEGEYNTIMHSSSGRGVKLLFSKSKVYVHPTPSSKDNIPGFIALIQQKSPAASERPSSSSSSATKKAHAASYLLAWLPESSLGGSYDSYVKVELSDGSSPPKQTPLVPQPPTTTTNNHAIGTYAFAVPVSEIYSLLIRPPSLGWWFGSVVINTRAGDSFPALFFHDDECQSTILQKKKLVRENFDPFGEAGGTFWGGDEVLRWLKRYVTMDRSGADPSVYLIEPSAEDKLGFGGKISNPNSPKLGSKAAGPMSISGPSAASSSNRDAGMDPVTKALKQARWSFLEKMSQVTTFARRTAQDVVENPKVPPQVRRLMKNPEVQTLQDEFDSARVYLARWAMGIAEQSERERSQRIFTAQDVLELEDTDVGEFELLDMEAGNMSLNEKRKPVTMKEWTGFFHDTSGRLQVTADEVKERIFLGGLDPSDGVRKEAWLFLLGVYNWDSTADERKAVINSKRDEFIKLKGAWWERMVDGSGSAEETEWWKEQKGRIEKDVHRTDRHIPLFEGEDIPHPDPDSPFAETGTNVHLEQMKDMLLTYNEYNRDLGYVQGMSDLLAPIYAVEQDDAVAFWGFVGFMERMERNFLRDQSGMRAQLLTLDHLVQLMDPALYLHLQSADSTNFFFFFRMLLVWYKREFEWADIQSTDDTTVNELSNTIDLPSTLFRAQSLFRRFQRTVEAIDKRNNFPSPKVRQRKPVDSGKSPENSNSSGASTGADGRRRPGSSTGEGEAKKEKIISPELRALLSRKVEVLDKKDVAEHGGGVGT